MTPLLPMASLLLTASLIAATPALATQAPSPPDSGRQAKAPKKPKPPALSGHAETRAERDKRLLRECRGKPNAGACEGYAN